MNEQDAEQFLERLRSEARDAQHYTELLEQALAERLRVNVGLISENVKLRRQATGGHVED